MNSSASLSTIFIGGVYALSPTLLSAPTFSTTSLLSNSFVAVSLSAYPVSVIPAVSLSFCLSFAFTTQFRVPILYVTTISSVVFPHSFANSSAVSSCPQPIWLYKSTIFCGSSVSVVSNCEGGVGGVAITSSFVVICGSVIFSIPVSFTVGWVGAQATSNNNSSNIVCFIVVLVKQ